MSRDDGGPAFPGPVAGPSVESGMTLRDWFATHALVGLLSCDGQVGIESRGNPDKAAEWSYEQADAMLAARALPDPQEDTMNRPGCNG